MALAYALLFVLPLNGEGPVEPALRLKSCGPFEADVKSHACDFAFSEGPAVPPKSESPWKSHACD
jgi:hypothetical protein